MTLLHEVIERMGIRGIGDFLGNDLVDLLTALDHENANTENLSKLVINRFGAYELLVKNKESRKNVFQTLSKVEAKELCNSLVLEIDDEPWQPLMAMSSVSNHHEKKILAFFGHPDSTPPAESPVGPSSSEVVPNYPLFNHQIAASKELWDYLIEIPYPRAVLHMPTGSGKTRTAMNIICKFIRDNDDGVVVWLANGLELCSQAADEFEKAWGFLGNRPVKVHRRYGRYKGSFEEISDGLLVTSYGTLHSKVTSETDAVVALSGNTKLVLVDEAHQAIAPTYKEAIQLLSCNSSTAIFGLTATPGRDTVDTEKDVQLAEFFRYKKVNLHIPGYDSPVKYLQDEGYLAQVDYSHVQWDPNNFELSPEEEQNLQNGFDLTNAQLKRMGKDVQRNLLIFERLMKEIDNGRKIIFFACSVEHSELISGILAAHGIESASITQNTPPAVRDAAIDDFALAGSKTQVLCNYGILATGFDAPSADCAFISRSSNSVLLYNQMVGRVARGPKTKPPGTERCLVITVKDKIRGFNSIQEGFEHWEEIWD